MKLYTPNADLNLCALGGAILVAETGGDGLRNQRDVRCVPDSRVNTVVRLLVSRVNRTFCRVISD